MRRLVPRAGQGAVAPVDLRAVVGTHLVHEAGHGKLPRHGEGLVGEQGARCVAGGGPFRDRAVEVDVGEARVRGAGGGAPGASEDQRAVLGAGVGDDHGGRGGVGGCVVRARAAGCAVDGAVAVGHGDGSLAAEAERVGALVVCMALPDDQRAVLRGPIIAILGGRAVTQVGGGVPVGPSLAHGVRPEPVPR